MNKENQPEGNYYNKYSNKNFLVKHIMSEFFRSIKKLLSLIDYSNVFDAGCGEGYVTNFIYNLKSGIEVEGMDISKKVIDEARCKFKQIDFHQGSILSIDRESDKYDLVVACEVLEHIESPEVALKEIFRISKRYVFISVPNEPVWRISNLLRGKYIKSFGNTPGHIQHWSKNEITNLVKAYGNIIKITNPFPWTMLLCEKKPDGRYKYDSKKIWS